MFNMARIYLLREIVKNQRDADGNPVTYEVALELVNESQVERLYKKLDHFLSNILCWSSHNDKILTGCELEEKVKDEESSDTLYLDALCNMVLYVMSES